MIFDFNIPYERVDFTTRAQAATSHILHLPERIFNSIIQIAKLALFAIACAFSLGKWEVLNDDLKLTGKRVITNLAGIATSLLGFFAPIFAFKCQMTIVAGLIPQPTDESPLKIMPYLLAV